MHAIFADVAIFVVEQLTLTEFSSDIITLVHSIIVGISVSYRNVSYKLMST